MYKLENGSIRVGPQFIEQDIQEGWLTTGTHNHTLYQYVIVSIPDICLLFSSKLPVRNKERSGSVIEC